MKNKTRQENGVTMLALVLTVVILLILTNVLIYNAKDNIYINSLTNLYNDISILREKVSEYYQEYGRIPAQIEYTNKDGLDSMSSVLSTQNDTGAFYVIDLEAMQGLTLNYGRDYENVKNIKDESAARSYTDLYIINENSHNIFYVKGIEVKENDEMKTYFTDYIEPDQTAINLRYVNGIIIPSGYYYIGKTSDNNENIVISEKQDDTVDISNENQYVWTKQSSKIESTPEDIKLKSNQEEYQFVASVNTYKGYFKNKNGNVQYVVIDEGKWSEAYTKQMEYEDKNRR